ncbi:helix-turn-helix transcriptional regulator [Ammoniphilus sp. 3BR4]|uniref:helix-turn-helix transcriptional regulator n=1 Tax=Ammoniphilus sp. 3BR4 TaxID=3158265 RepID=UPI003466BB12
MGTSRLKVILAEKDITIKELAAATGLSRNNLTAIVNGKQRPYIDNAYMIAEALGMHIDRVFPNYYKYESKARRRTKSG